MKQIILLVVLACANAGSVAAQDDSDAATRSKIVALEQAWNQAYKLGDAKALDAILDNSIMLVNDDGSSQSKAEFLASLRATNSQGQQVSPESLTVHVFGTTAIA